MATNDRTHAGQPGPVLSYLGRPCTLAPMIEDRADEAEFDRLKGEESRRLVQRLGDALATNEARIRNARIVVERLEEMAVDGADHSEIESVLGVLRDYLLHTWGHAFETGTVALAVLHSADLIAPSQQQRAEAAHG